MKKMLMLMAVIICIVTSAISDSMAVYTKTLPTISGTITATKHDLGDYPTWSYEKEVSHEYKVNDIVVYNGKLYIRKDSGLFKGETPDKNKSWVLF